MLKKRYYFTICALPSLSLDQPPVMKFEEASRLILVNASQKDKTIIEKFLQYLDIKNLVLHWRGLPLDGRANLNEMDLEGAILREEFFPHFVFDFLHRFEDKSLRFRHFGHLLSQYYHLMEKEGGFLSWYFQQERKIELITTLIRSRKLKRNLAVELENEDPNDELLKGLIQSSEMSSESEGDPDYRAIKKIYETLFDQPLELQKGLIQYRLKNIEKTIPTLPWFSIDVVLAYLARLLIIEDWHKLLITSGKEKIQEWVSA